MEKTISQNRLEERLIEFATNITTIKSTLKNGFESNHLYQQIFRSATSIPLNYGESRGGFTIKDFVYKISLCLKETRETHINLRIMKKAGLCEQEEILISLIDEANQLISIFTKTLDTTRKKYADLLRK